MNLDSNEQVIEKINAKHSLQKCFKDKNRERAGLADWYKKGESIKTVQRLVWIAYAVDHQMHNGLWHQVPNGPIDDAHVGVD